MYLDFFLEDGAEVAPHKRHPQCKTLDGVITEAIRHVKRSFASAGYVGIYQYEDGPFLGFIIKEPGQEPYFDDDENKCPLDYRYNTAA